LAHTGLSVADLREEAVLMQQFDHVRLCCVVPFFEVRTVACCCPSDRLRRDVIPNVGVRLLPPLVTLIQFTCVLSLLNRYGLIFNHFLSVLATAHTCLVYTRSRTSFAWWTPSRRAA
jgi:hypothetical protein